jgi:glycosyltransferase involved in cell wall biosynthesis
MKILQINNYHYLKGGSEKVYFETSRILEDNGDNEVIHFSVCNDKNFNSRNSSYFIKQRKYDTLLNKLINLISFFYSFEAKRKLSELIKDEKPDIAHVHIFYGRLTSSILGVLRKYNIPIVMTIHEYKMLCPQYLFLNDKGNICEKCANGNTIFCVINRCNKGSFLNSFISAVEVKLRDIFFNYERNIDMFIFVSSFVYNKHIEYIPSLKDKSIVLNNTVDFSRFKPLEKKGNYFLYFGRLSKEKGILNLLIVAGYDKSINYKIIGNGPLSSEVKAIIEENNLYNVELLGPKYNDDLITTIQDSSFVISPSMVYETFGLSILESFACSKPVIASDIGAFPELVNKERGYLFDYLNTKSLFDAVNKANKLDYKSYIHLSREALKFANENFKEQSYYDNLMNIYIKLLDEK